MSGIYGFTYRSTTDSAVENTIGGLAYWNKIYGSAAVQNRILGTSALGCHVEHFSDRFGHDEPVLSYRGTPAVVDALIYNREELLRDLQMDPDSAISDERLLLELIDRKGMKALRQINGDFAGAIFDPGKQEWTLFRDHMGVRPLYYYFDNDKIIFSTDLRGILSAPDVDGAVNGEYLYNFILGINYLTPVETEYRHIRCIHPGSFAHLRMTESKCEFTQTVYWKVRERKIRMRSDDDYRRKMRELVTDAVHRRCDAIPGLLGAELSGGLDSCLIDILINRHGRDALYYSWCVPPERHPLVEGDDERKVVLDVCRQENITCRFKQLEDYVPYSVELTDYMPPFVNSLSMAAGSKWMKPQGVNVVFSGHGGDEGVSHRASPFELLCNFELWAYFKIHWHYLKGKKLRVLRALRSAYQEAKMKIPANMFYASEECYDLPLFTKEFNQHMYRDHRVRATPFRYAPYRYVRQGGSRFRLDTAAYLGAYCGVRYLFPFIDHRVMDFSVSIPRRLHVNHVINRLIIRESFSDLLPDSLKELRYKDAPSLRNSEKPEVRTQQFQNGMSSLLQRLDQDLWKGILDFERLEDFSHREVLSSDDVERLNLVSIKLTRFIMVQNILENAGRWRELDE